RCPTPFPTRRSSDLPHRPARSAEARRPEARSAEARPPEARSTELCEAVGIGLGSNNFAELGGAGEPRGAGREMKLPRWVLSAHRRTLKNLPPAMKRKASMLLATSSSVTVLCHRIRFPAVQGFEGPRGFVAITVPRAGYLTAALSARPPVLSPSWPPGITASAIELRPHGSARRPDRPCERGARAGRGPCGAV